MRRRRGSKAGASGEPPLSDFAGQLARAEARRRAFEQAEARRRGVPVEQVAAETQAQARAAMAAFEADLAARDAAREEKRRGFARAIGQGAAWLLFFAIAVAGLVWTSRVSEQAGGAYLLGLSLVFVGAQGAGWFSFLAIAAGLLLMLGGLGFALVAWVF